ncbi:hypothetical protein PIB30_019924 [Stylosanthes scabra]|uniref:Secreted protein n=1 Tax=Stylosanthes scabra TaxID=79078 RepID=A0ABU6V6J3_9FABA|nr:hypothetical protein [Stylosanthes scabra]
MISLLLLFFDPCGRMGELILASSANCVSGFDDDKYAPTKVTFVLLDPPLCIAASFSFCVVANSSPLGRAVVAPSVAAAVPARSSSWFSRRLLFEFDGLWM